MTDSIGSHLKTLQVFGQVDLINLKEKFRCCGVPFLFFSNLVPRELLDEVATD